MADFVIPKGKEFSFTVNVIEKDSFLAQDLTNIDTAIISLYKAKDMMLHSEPITGTVVDALNGVLSFNMLSTYTNGLLVERGSKADNYYLKPTYYALVEVTFLDATEPITALIDKIYVAPTGA